MKRINYAWVICAAALLLMICNMGLCSNILTVYLPLIEATGISGSQGSAILSIRCIFSFLSIFFVSRFYEKLSFRTGIAVSFAIGALSSLVFSFGSGKPAVCFAAAALAGICYGLGATIPASILIKNWFREKRGLALGIASSGTGICTVIFSPLIADLVEKQSLRSAFLFQMVFMLISGTVAFLLIREKPSDMGLAPLGVGEEEKTSDREARQVSLRKSMIALLLFAMLLLGGAGQSFSGHMSILMTSCSYPVKLASEAVSVFGFALMVSKLLFGTVADTLGTKRATVLFCAVFLLGCVPVIWMDGKNVLLCYLFAGLLGTGAAVFNVGVPLWVSDLSSSDCYEETLRRFQLFYSLGGIIFTALPGFIADRTGEYKSSYLLFAVSVLACLLIVLRAYRQAARRE